MAVYRTLFSTAEISISDYRCRCPKGGPLPAEDSSTTDVVFVRRGVFRRHIQCCEEIADPNQVLFFRPDQEYRISHPSEGGDDCTVVSFQHALLDEALRSSSTARNQTVERPFAETSRPVSVHLFQSHWALVHLLFVGAPKLEIEDSAMRLVRGVFEAEPPSRSTVRVATLRAHRELAMETQQLLSRFDGVGLEEMALMLHTSPYHLSRVFLQQTGRTLASYRSELRIRKSMVLLAQSSASVSEVGRQVGFATASYYVSRFQEVVGMTPNQFRTRAGVRLGR